MNSINDYEIFQNRALGAHAIWEFCKYYEDFSESKEGPVLLLTLPVLPIVFNKRATDQIKSRNFKEGSLIKTITETKDIYTGLQERMEYTIEHTFKSVFIAVSANLLLYDKDSTRLITNRKSEPQIKNHQDYNDIISSSRRVGAWFGQLTLQEISDYFNIKF